ncbi:MAG: flagellar biosynthetic protein FliP [Waddliaceae bacterium]|nr:flagellar biosynthetic protein FliP [Waddliaceae bacterium]
MDSALNSPNPFEQAEFMNLHSQLRIAGFLTVLTLLPFVLVMMTSFTRLTIVLHFLRQALATQQVPSNQIIVGLSFILTGFVMHPVITDINENALTPYFNNTFKESPEVRMGLKSEDSMLMERAWQPLRLFMLHHTREKDMQLFLDLGKVELPVVAWEDVTDAPEERGTGSAYDLSAIPWYCLTPAFVLSELRTAFMMGFLLFLPFLVIDMIIASILMSMGMMMLPPVMISMPFKLLLFILIDGWRLIIQQLVNGFYPMG